MRLPKANYIKINGINTAYFEYLGTSKSKYMVMLHGWSGSTEISFHKIIQQIKAKKTELNIISLDLPGFGNSQMPPESGWSTYDYGYWLNTFLEQKFVSKKIKNLELYLYGHSFGGKTIVRFATNQPKCLEPAGIILTGAAGVKWPLRPRERISFWLSQNLKIAKKTLPAGVQKLILKKIFKAHDYVDTPGPMKQTFQKHVQENDVRFSLRHIQTPTLIIWGQQDLITPLKSGKVYHDYLPNSQFKIIKNCRHGVHHTHSELVTNYVCNFIR